MRAYRASYYHYSAESSISWSSANIDFVQPISSQRRLLQASIQTHHSTQIIVIATDSPAAPTDQDNCKLLIIGQFKMASTLNAKIRKNRKKDSKSL